MTFRAHSFFLYAIFTSLVLGLSSQAATVNAVWNTAADVPVSASSYTATGSTVNFALNFAPATGTSLMVVNNTGLPFINGTFDNLAQGQTVSLSYNGTSYPFVASYYGGTGNDLVLVWASSRLVAWGYNAAGEIGNNSTTDSGIPVAVTTAGTPLAGRTLLALSAGNEHSLALCSDGTLVSWGHNADGELGNNTTTNSSVPMAVTTAGTPLQGRFVIAIGSGYEHNLALCSDGTLVSWGFNAVGQLGNNTATTSSVPVAVTTVGTPLAGKTVVAIAVGASHNIVLCSDGTLAAWGANSAGQLGNPIFPRSRIPVAVTTAGTALEGKNVVSIAAGGSHSIALCSDGTVVAWGSNGDGQLGNDDPANSRFPVAVSTSGTVLAGKTVIAISAGYYHSMALCSDGTMAAWGSNYNGQLGTNYSDFMPWSVDRSGVLAGKTVVELTAGASFSMARCSDGTVAAWG